MREVFLTVCILITGFIYSCTNSSVKEPLFNALPTQSTGIDFTNTLEYTAELNPYTFKNFYNGAGVAVGDINNDDLPDIFFCGNMVSNRLYLNKGGLKFEDITEKAGLKSEGVWSTGVNLVDINADGYLDIYVCKSGPPGGQKRYNELFINNGDLTFSEKAKQYGLDNTGLSVQTAFFDYDKDGDLDCYLLNNSIRSIGSFGLKEDLRMIPDTLGANKFYRNDEGFFNDITLSSGIYSSEIGFGLGAMVGDINGDNWPDIYISNDFFEKDYLYINQKDGTFKDELEEFVQETAMGSMGADLADINNDGNPEYFVTEMLPERRDRQVTKAFYDSWEGYRQSQDLGYYNQFSRNVLQLNNGDGTFSEIGRYAGVEATDWSWAALIFDMDNDGLKDIFVANGIYKDLLDMDYLKFMADPKLVRGVIQTERNAIKLMIDKMPSEPVPNYTYQNNGDLTFSNKSADWGMAKPTFSNGSAYSDLDNDGDLDLVVNNINMPSLVYENRSRQLFPQRNFLGLRLEGSGSNTAAIGAKVKVYIDGEILYQELNPARGFQSCVDNKLVIGTRENTSVDSLIIIWPSERISRLYNVEANQVLELSEKEAVSFHEPKKVMEEAIFKQYTNSTLTFRHKESEYSDFDRNRTLFHMSSTEGPCICKGDVNNDGFDDIYIGGASGQSGQLLVQSDEGNFTASGSSFQEDVEGEDLDCVFFDANNDGNKDLYITSGSSEFGSFSVWLNDRLYFGDGAGGFVKSNQRLPFKGFESTSVVVPLDFDKDGDSDLFVGGRSIPTLYGIPADSYLLINDGKGKYQPYDGASASVLKRLGMVTDAVLTDLNSDGENEIVVVGRWMPLKVLDLSGGEIHDVSTAWGTDDSNGWYNTITVEDVNQDGKPDLLVGNHGLNTRFHASKDEPLEMFIGDFDDNGTYDQMISMYWKGEKYPFVQLQELEEEIPFYDQKYESFNDYKNDKTETVIPNEAKSHIQRLQVYNLASGIFINDGKKLRFERMAMHGQLSPVYAIKTGDFNEDGIIDFILGGNFSRSKPEVGTYLGSFGALFQGTGNGGFSYIPNEKAGFRIKGEIRDIEELGVDDKKVLVFGRNNDEIYTVWRAK